MCTNGSSSKDLWSELASADGEAKPTVLAELFRALASEDSKDLFTVGFEAIEGLRKSGEYQKAAEVALQLVFHLFEASRHEEAQKLIEELLQHELLVDNHEAGTLHWNLAIIHDRKNKRQQAAVQYRIAYEFFKDIYSVPSSLMLQNRAVCLSKLGRWDEAESLFWKALEQFEEEGHVGFVADCKFAFGSELFSKKKFEKAEKFFFDAMSIYDFLGVEDLKQATQVWLGRTLSELNRVDDARFHFEKVAQNPIHPNRSIEAEALFYLADIWQRIGNNQKARSEYQRLVPILRACGNSELAEIANGRTKLITIEEVL